MQVIVNIRARRRATIALLTLALVACTPAEPALGVEQARFKIPLPGKTVSAGYFELRNPTAADEELVSVSANIGSSVEIHRTTERDGQVRMERIKTLSLPAGAQLSFAPGGYHLMLFGVTQLPPQTAVTLQFASGNRLTATFAAERW